MHQLKCVCIFLNGSNDHSNRLSNSLTVDLKFVVYWTEQTVRDDGQAKELKISFDLFQNRFEKYNNQM